MCWQSQVIMRYYRDVVTFLYHVRYLKAIVEYDVTNYFEVISFLIFEGY